MSIGFVSQICILAARAGCGRGWLVFGELASFRKWYFAPSVRVRVGRVGGIGVCIVMP